MALNVKECFKIEESVGNLDPFKRRQNNKEGSEESDRKKKTYRN